MSRPEPSICPAENFTAGEGMNVLDAQSVVLGRAPRRALLDTSFQEEDDSPLMGSPACSPGLK